MKLKHKRPSLLKIASPLMVAALACAPVMGILSAGIENAETTIIYDVYQETYGKIAFLTAINNKNLRLHVECTRRF